MGVRGLGDEDLTGVGIHGGDDVEDPLVQEAGGELVLPVVAEQELDDVECHLRALDLVPVDVGVDVEAGLPLGGACLRVGESHGPDVPASVALPRRSEGHEPWVGLGEGREARRELGVAVEVVEAQGSGSMARAGGVAPRNASKRAIAIRGPLGMSVLGCGGIRSPINALSRSATDGGTREGCLVLGLRRALCRGAGARGPIRS